MTEKVSIPINVAGVPARIELSHEEIVALVFYAGSSSGYLDLAMKMLTDASKKQLEGKPVVIDPVVYGALARDFIALGNAHETHITKTLVAQLTKIAALNNKPE